MQENTPALLDYYKNFTSVVREVEWRFGIRRQRKAITPDLEQLVTTSLDKIGLSAASPRCGSFQILGRRDEIETNFMAPEC